MTLSKSKMTRYQIEGYHVPFIVGLYIAVSFLVCSIQLLPGNYRHLYVPFPSNPLRLPACRVSMRSSPGLQLAYVAVRAKAPDVPRSDASSTLKSSRLL